MLSKLRPKLEPLSKTLAGPLSFLHPNVISILGFLFAVAFYYFFTKGEYWLAFWALVGTCLDFFDGAVARLTKKESAFGGVLDSTLDRASDALLIVAFGVERVVVWEIIWPLLVLSFLISYLRSRAELAGGGKFKLDVGIIERSERVLFIGFCSLYIATFPDWHEGPAFFTSLIFMLLGVLSFITVLQRLFLSYKRLK